MNLYEVYTKGIETEGSYDPPSPPDPCDYWGLIIHETRGKAKWMGFQDFTSRDKWIAEFTDMRSKLIKKDVNGPARLVTEEQEYFWEVCRKEHAVSKCEDCEECCEY